MLYKNTAKGKYGKKNRQKYGNTAKIRENGKNKAKTGKKYGKSTANTATVLLHKLNAKRRVTKIL